MSNTDKVRKFLVDVITDYRLKADDALAGRRKHFPAITPLLKKILKHPDILVKAENQELPDFNQVYPNSPHSKYGFARHSAWDKSQQAMLSAGWVKVEQKGVRQNDTL